ncbi:hypothetical protein HSBAA_29330 [Vreelandella sulfidaeris]|uniref:Uncharacterized protein n=1 Tax=Vreelandella sulfidaeris TaxID=115553 RepID=A0A455U7X1_9GAMM|nr:hypothetical protein HSBAA_29330 [Halomonas sulfidaeris]
MNSRPVKHIPLAELPENLRDRYRGRKGVELYEDLSTSDMDEVVMSEIKRDLLLREADLMASKWFDYRILHPWQATALFLEAYRSEHAWVMRKREDVNSHWFHKGIKATSLVSLYSYTNDVALESATGRRQHRCHLRLLLPHDHGLGRST